MPDNRDKKLDIDLILGIEESLDGCAFVEHALALEGVAPETAREWLDRRAEGGVYEMFASTIKIAPLDAEERLLAVVGKAADEGSWPAATWLLERRFGERWSLRRPPLDVEPLRAAL